MNIFNQQYTLFAELKVKPAIRSYHRRPNLGKPSGLEFLFRNSNPFGLGPGSVRRVCRCARYYMMSFVGSSAKTL